MLLGDERGYRGPVPPAGAKPPAGLKQGQLGRKWRSDGLPVTPQRTWRGGEDTAYVAVDRKMGPQRSWMYREEPYPDRRFEPDVRGFVLEHPAVQGRMGQQTLRSPFDHATSDWGMRSGDWIGSGATRREDKVARTQAGVSRALVQRVTDRGAEERVGIYSGGGLMGFRGYAGALSGVNVYNGNPEDVRHVGFRIVGDKVLVKRLPEGVVSEVPISEFVYRERIAIIGMKIRGSVSDPPYTFYVVSHSRLGDVFFTGSVGVLSGKVPIEDVRSRAGGDWNPDPKAKEAKPKGGKKPADDSKAPEGSGPGDGGHQPSAFQWPEVPWTVYVGVGVLAVGVFLWTRREA